MMADDSSSCYSADNERGREPPCVGAYEKLLPPLPTQPVTLDIEHQIRDIGGFTVSAELSPIRLQVSKKNVPRSQEERQRRLDYDLDSLKWENEFFGVCNDAFHETLFSVLDVSNEIISQCQLAALKRMWQPEDEPMSKEFMRDAVGKLDAKVQRAHQKEEEAKNAWLDKWKQKKDVEVLMPWI
ncbi:uncharacterized protein TRUGW13939_09691 [Talaromyces rugulosus]|uniref:Uncharacterized protein n=1 Tax=Talaromyces rugulosus TaxID=121627 RepID=A0A7H8R822_TALRU|nr:uncharacterized protein TRUGW13939_09691 [Talaromyces rugulosus]QKX62530.1 hypothetical protein TRUGW13939_09691 [Talaromyces rugulosus]